MHIELVVVAIVVVALVGVVQPCLMSSSSWTEGWTWRASEDEEDGGGEEEAAA